jgi:hypothetical protein
MPSFKLNLVGDIKQIDKVKYEEEIEKEMF